MTKDLQKRIEELEEFTKPRYEFEIDDRHIFQAEKDVAKKALSIIKELQEEVDKYKLLWESDAEDSKAIIAEQEEEIKQLKEKLNDK